MKETEEGDREEITHDEEKIDRVEERQPGEKSIENQEDTEPEEESEPEEETEEVREKTMDEEWAEVLHIKFDTSKIPQVPPAVPKEEELPPEVPVEEVVGEQVPDVPHVPREETVSRIQEEARRRNPEYFDREPMPSTYLLWSILTTIFCCFIPGIVAIIFSSQVSSKYYAGDMEGARRASRNAEAWIIVSFVLGVLTATLYVPMLLIN